MYDVTTVWQWRLSEIQFILLKTKERQESPAWTQEAYRPPCSEYSFCCPNWVLTGRAPPHILTWPGGYPGGGYPTWLPPWQGTPQQGTPLSWPWGVPCQGVPYVGTPWQGTPAVLTWQGTPLLSWPGRVPPPTQTWPGTPLGVCPMEFWVMLQSIMGYGYSLPQVWTN